MVKQFVRHNFRRRRHIWRQYLWRWGPKEYIIQTVNKLLVYSLRSFYHSTLTLAKPPSFWCSAQFPYANTNRAIINSLDLDELSIREQRYKNLLLKTLGTHRINADTNVSISAMSASLIFTEQDTPKRIIRCSKAI